MPLSTEKELGTGECPERHNKNNHEVKGTVLFLLLSEVGTGPGLAGCGLEHISDVATCWLPPPGDSRLC